MSNLGLYALICELLYLILQLWLAVGLNLRILSLQKQLGGEKQVHVCILPVELFIPLNQNIGSRTKITH